jgi:gamma-glutamyltranspeptidase/glutathione hydrolase
MLYAARSLKGMTTAPHRLAADAGARVLREGGNAAEAAVAMAAALAAVYPHMNSIGGDSFWLLAEPGQAPVAIDACGRAGAGVTLDLYRGLSSVPWRGPLAANTVAGTLSGWALALETAAAWGGRLPLTRLVEEAVGHAEEGVVVSPGGAETFAAKWAELSAVEKGSIRTLVGATSPAVGQVLKQPALAATLRRLAADGPDSFYRGALAAEIAADLAALGSPITAADLAAHRAERVTPLEVDVAEGRLYNLPPPTQGFASLLILALFDRLAAPEAESFAHIHGLVEATKRAFRLRDRHVGDPAYMSIDPQAVLSSVEALDRLAVGIDPTRAAPWPHPSALGDTVWFGAIDAAGRAASVIQSTYFEFGSGLVLPNSGIVWQNRGASFRLAETGWNALKPGRKPFHTLNPAMARLKDGRTMVYGTMGGEGQPQTQAAVFTRYARYGQDLQAAVTAPRWLLGRTWGEESTSLKLESRFDPALVEALKAAGHAVELVAPFTATMGHAGAVVRRADGTFEGASDPRSDGGVGAW